MKTAKVILAPLSRRELADTIRRLRVPRNPDESGALHMASCEYERRYGPDALDTLFDAIEKTLSS